MAALLAPQPDEVEYPVDATSFSLAPESTGRHTLGPFEKRKFVERFTLMMFQSLTLLHTTV
jgi:hypothetical protein